MIFKVGRNDSCSCNSGKKYKKCCLKNNMPINDFEGMNIINNAIPDKEFHDHRETLPEEKVTLLNQLFYSLNRLKKLQQWQVTELFDSLEIFFKQYPKNPIAVGYLYTGYLILEDTKKQAFFLDILQKQFPYYIYGRIMSAQAALRNYQVDEALHFLGNTHTLKALAPTRILFHLKETIHFHMLLIESYIEKDHEEFIARHSKNLVHLMQTVEGSYECENLIEIIDKKIGIWLALKQYDFLSNQKRNNQSFATKENLD